MEFNPAHRPIMPNAYSLYEKSNTTQWSTEDNTIFEEAIFILDEDTPDRWHKIAAWIPGKTWFDVLRHYKKLVADINKIHAGNCDFPKYTPSSCTTSDKEVVDGAVEDSSDQKGKKVVKHWTTDEHRRFLMGLQRYGEGAWKLIADNCVVTRDHKQVASHAQKYNIRQKTNSEEKKRKRISIHDMTIETIRSNKMNECHIPPLHQNLTAGVTQVQDTTINHHNNVAQMSLNANPNNLFEPRAFSAHPNNLSNSFCGGNKVEDKIA